MNKITRKQVEYYGSKILLFVLVDIMVVLIFSLIQAVSKMVQLDDCNFNCCMELFEKYFNAIIIKPISIISMIQVIMIAMILN